MLKRTITCGAPNILADTEDEDSHEIAVNPVVNEILLTGCAKVVEKITTYRNCCWRWPFFLPDAQSLALEIFHELDYMLRDVHESEFARAFKRLRVQVDARELKDFIRKKKFERRERDAYRVASLVAVVQTVSSVCSFSWPTSFCWGAAFSSL